MTEDEQKALAQLIILMAELQTAVSVINTVLESHLGGLKELESGIVLLGKLLGEQRKMIVGQQQEITRLSNALDAYISGGPNLNLDLKKYTA